ncbi:hypothetical protein [Terrimicrobium sacchariphilum]|uniref:hypothetical protein n=1 Tax=Terrimicrobium sacchariphilum TaxID=690879 RepID=UPI001EDA9CE4|nr:hypothetical protein [Terrimicrobium sacchariphilum]
MLTEIPEELWPIIGSPDKGTRIYRRESASEEEIADWYDLLTQLVGPTVSPGGVSMYCPVSRAAVHKRVQEGKMSMFLFHVSHRKTTLFGKERVLRQSPFAYIPVSEAKAWRKELEERAVKQGIITETELREAKPEWKRQLVQRLVDSGAATVGEIEGEAPDWRGDFMLWPNKKERKPDLGTLEVLKHIGSTMLDGVKKSSRKVKLLL